MSGLFSKFSLKLNVVGKGGVDTAVEEASENNLKNLQKEVYKVIHEDICWQKQQSTTEAEETDVQATSSSLESAAESNLESTTTQTEKIVSGEVNMVQEENVNDGADEQMLNDEDKEKLADRREEVKFIKGDHQNGDAKIDIGGTNGKVFTGMTKEELMKYANDPFWVRLRWICFIGFWLIWLAMLIGAILIIIGAPKCAAPQPLPWYKRGPLVQSKASSANAEDLAIVQKLQASGIIYELPVNDTYLVKDVKVEALIKQIVNHYKDSNTKVILDLTANYVPRNSPLFQNALTDESKRSAFVWTSSEPPSGWRAIDGSRSAWVALPVGQPGQHVLSQFGNDLFDLNMNDTIVRAELASVLRHLIGLGVAGIRFKHSKHFIIRADLVDEVQTSNPKYNNQDEYGFWTHEHSTFQTGLGDVLHAYRAIVKNASSEAFLAVADDVVRPEVYRTSQNAPAVDMLVYAHLIRYLSTAQSDRIVQELRQTVPNAGNGSWIQWNFADVAENSIVDPTAMALFITLLPGVPIVPTKLESIQNISKNLFEHINKLRSTPSYMHGEFQLHNSTELIAYSRIKSGNPGYFVVFNPTDQTVAGNFTKGLPDKMSVEAISSNFNVSDIKEKAKVSISSLQVTPYSTIILTYVPCEDC